MKQKGEPQKKKKGLKTESLLDTDDDVTQRAEVNATAAQKRGNHTKGEKEAKANARCEGREGKKKKRCFFRFSLEMSKENRRGETREEKEIMNTDAEKERIFAVLKQSSKTSK